VLIIARTLDGFRVSFFFVLMCRAMESVIANVLFAGVWFSCEASAADDGQQGHDARG
jgi:NAD/NADP transhydrogenase beta subunit